MEATAPRPAPASPGPDVEVFEIFKMGPQSRQALLAQGLPSLRAKYSLLSPITDVSQFETCEMIAQLPEPGHMVVDKKKLEALLAENVRRAVDEKRVEQGRTVDAAVEKMQKEYAAGLQAGLADLDRLRREQSAKNEQLLQLLVSGNDLEQVRSAVRAAIEADQAQLAAAARR